MLRVKLIHLSDLRYGSEEEIIGYREGITPQMILHSTELSVIAGRKSLTREDIAILNAYDEAMKFFEGMDCSDLSVAHSIFELQQDVLYALSLVAFSRNGKYVTYRRLFSWRPELNLWDILRGLDMDLFVAYDNHYEKLSYDIDFDLFGCEIKNLYFGGVVYDTAIMDICRQQAYVDVNGVLHHDGDLADHEWLWQAHLPEIIEHYAHNSNCAVSMTPQIIEDLPEFFNMFERESRDYVRIPTHGDRVLYKCLTTAVYRADKKYPYYLYFKKYEDGWVEVVEKSGPDKYPEFSESMEEIFSWWSGDAIAAFCVVINSDTLEDMSEFKDSVIWGVEDTGCAAVFYSEHLAARRLVEFIGDCEVIPDYWEFVDLIPPTNLDMRTLLSGKWGELYKSRYLREWEKSTIYSGIYGGVL